MPADSEDGYMCVIRMPTPQVSCASDNQWQCRCLAMRPLRLSSRPTASAAAARDICTAKASVIGSMSSFAAVAGSSVPYMHDCAGGEDVWRAGQPLRGPCGRSQSNASSEQTMMSACRLPPLVAKHVPVQDCNAASAWPCCEKSMYRSAQGFAWLSCRSYHDT